MSEHPVPAELINHLCRHSQLNEEEAQRLIGEVLAFYDETPDLFIQRRHRELQGLGLPNAAIFSRLKVELASHRFLATVLSERQIRRVIYG